jgi:hypothetical protein
MFVSYVPSELLESLICLVTTTMIAEPLLGTSSTVIGPLHASYFWDTLGYRKLKAIQHRSCTGIVLGGGYRGNQGVFRLLS